MKRLTKFWSVSLAAMLLLSACATAAGGIAVLPAKETPLAEPKADEDKLRELALAQLAFALDVYKQTGKSGENLFYSPYSLYQALMMAYAGAGGMTAEQMARVLHLPANGPQVHEWAAALNQLLHEKPEGLEPDQGFSFTVANALWGQKDFPFKQEYLDTLSKYYATAMRTVDFANAAEASKLINDWVAEQTADKIKDLVPENAISALTRLILTNAVYFKAPWADQFDAQSTDKQPFHLADGGTVEVDMMHSHGRLNYWAGEGYQAVELPYEGFSKSMIVLLPDADLAALRDGLTPEAVSAFFSAAEYRLVDLSLPRFKVESSFSAGDVLKALGMSEAFDPDLADFSGMSEAEKLMIQDVLHKAYVDVNEEGTEAAAATAVIVGTTSAPAPEDPISFMVDKPFLFLIVDRPSQSVLFLGQVAQP